MESTSLPTRRTRPSHCASRLPSLAHIAVVALAVTLIACSAPTTSTRPPRTAVGPAAAPPSRERIAVLVASLARETADVRGLAFRSEVPFRVETVEQMGAHFRQALTEEREEIESEQAIGIAMGVLPVGTDLIDSLSRLVGAEAQGYYDPDERILVIAEAEAVGLASPGPAGMEARATVVHELTHALQHQHFEHRVETNAARQPGLSDASRARLALLEGDATLVAMEWAARRRGGRLLGQTDMRARLVRWAEGAQVLTEANVAPYIIESAEAPYEAGTLAVGELYVRGGWARVNAASTSSSTRSAELLHPDRADGAYVQLTPDDAAIESRLGVVRVRRALGEIELRLYLQRVMRAERAAVVAETWRGDDFALFTAPDGQRMRWRIACDGPEGARALASAMQPFLERWAHEGCPGLAGGTTQACPGRIVAENAIVRIERGRAP